MTNLDKFVNAKMFDVKDVKLPDIFLEFFCVEDMSDNGRNDMSMALNEVGNYAIEKIDQVLHKALGLKGSKITRNDILTKIDEAVVLSKSIKELIGYERLVQDVVDDPAYTWKLMVLDGANYVNKTGNSNLELLYPSLGVGKFRRHFYKDIITLSKQRKHIHHDETQERLQIVLNFLFVVRVALKKTHTEYKNTVNITDILLKLLCKARYGMNWTSKWNTLRTEYLLRDIDV